MSSDSNALVSQSDYGLMYEASLSDAEKFWREQAQKYLDWSKPFSQSLEGSFQNQDVRWFLNGKLNPCYNCLDRHLPANSKKTAIIWEGNDTHESSQISYEELHKQVCKFANVLKSKGLKKGDRIAIYMPMIIEAVVAMLACVRLGIVHTVIFAGFSPDAIEARVNDCQCRLVVTSDEAFRGDKIIPLKKNIDLALQKCSSVENVIVVKRTGRPINWEASRDSWYHDEMNQAASECPCVEMDSNDDLFILYTSGSTGKPKGILHSLGGYLVYVAMTHALVFNYRADDIYWCTADIGWITGHSYVVYGPLCNAATTVMFEGAPNYPTPARMFEVVDKYQVTTLYTSPTAIRALRQQGDEWIKKTSRKSLRLLGTVGEPINPDVWEWYFDVVGDARCPVMDTWWQTETGGVLISALPYATPLKPGSASWPFFGVKPVILNNEGDLLPANVKGKLAIAKPWPGMMKTIYGNHERFINAYFKEFPGYYLTGDDAYYDKEGYFWILGRNDDVLKVSGHRLGTAEVENAFLKNEAVAEAAVVGIPHDIKGESIYAYVTLKDHVEPSEKLKKELIATVRNTIGPIAAPDVIQWATALPKTRSGKIMRRVLRKIANKEEGDLGDVSTLADPAVVDDLIGERSN